MSKKTIESLVRKGLEYVIQVKANQRSLHQFCKDLAKEHSVLDSYFHKEKSHGRDSEWKVRVYDVSMSGKAREWFGLERVIQVEKQTMTNSNYKENTRYYISNRKDTCAKYFHQGIRNHWKIENCLHWAKDVFHGEDGNRIANKAGAINWSIFSTISINLHRITNKLSILQSQIKFASNIKFALKAIRT